MIPTLAELQRAKREREEEARRQRQTNYGSSSSYTPATDYTPGYNPPVVDSSSPPSTPAE